jgi:hypothetical protein
MRIEVPVGGIGVAKVCCLDSLLYTVFFWFSLSRHTSAKMQFDEGRRAEELGNSCILL